MRSARPLIGPAGGLLLTLCRAPMGTCVPASAGPSTSNSRPAPARTRAATDDAVPDVQLRHQPTGLVGEPGLRAIVLAGADPAFTGRGGERDPGAERRTAKGDGRMRLPATAHTSRPWRIHELTPDFHLEDVWALPTPGNQGDLPRLVAQIASNDFPRGAPLLVRVLWAARWKLGALLGWDRPEAGLDARVTTLRDRLPPDLRDAPPAPEIEPFTPLYLLEDEYAAEIANRTVHAVLHLGWVRDGSGRYRGQMAVLVKPNGPLGAAYMAAIKPLRHLLVYPALLASMQRSWQTQQAPGAAEPHGEPHAPR